MLNVVTLSVVMLSTVMLSIAGPITFYLHAECHYAGCRSTPGHIVVDMLDVVVSSVVMLNVVASVANIIKHFLSIIMNFGKGQEPTLEWST